MAIHTQSDKDGIPTEDAFHGKDVKDIKSILHTPTLVVYVYESIT